MNDHSNTKQKLAATLGVIAIVVIAAVIALGGRSTTPSEVTSTTPGQDSMSRTSTEEPADSNADASYADGMYTAVGEYRSPGGIESISVSLTIKDGVVTETSAQGSENSSTSTFYQNQFVKNYKESVVGKNIDEIKLDRVAGSSLTPQGFNNALETVKADAVI